MKKNSSPLLLPILMLSIIYTFSSCIVPRTLIEGSFDESHRRYRGPSYEGSSSVDVGDAGFNVGLSLNLGLNKTIGSVGHSSIYDPRNFKNQLALVKAQNFMSISAAKPGENSFTAPETGDQKNVAGNINILTGLSFVLKNSKDGGTKVHTGYLEIPALAVYNYKLNNNGTIFGGFGPYFAYGIGGKTSGQGFSISSFDKDLGFKRFDAGLSLTAGYTIENSFRFRFGYDIGLANIQPGGVDKARNSSWNICIAYPINLFGK